MLKSLKKILPNPVIRKKEQPSGRFPDDDMMQGARSIDARLTGHEFKKARRYMSTMQ